MVRSIEGHGRVSTRYPPAPGPTGLPAASTTSAAMPGNGRVAEPGLVAVMPGNGVMRMQPVSVCHHVSTMGQRPRPIVSWYQIHASGLIGSPTVPINRRDVSLYFAGHSLPQRMNVRIAVGAV